MLYAEPTVFIFKIHPCFYVIPNIILTGYFFVNAQHNVDLYIKLRLLIKKGQFSQQLTITEENNINSGTWSP